MIRHIKYLTFLLFLQNNNVFTAASHFFCPTLKAEFISTSQLTICYDFLKNNINNSITYWFMLKN